VKLLYKPMSLLAGILAGKAANAAFQAVWSTIDERQPPKPTTEAAPLHKVLAAAVLEAGTQAAMGALADRLAAQAFNHLFGVWPGEKRQES
jgi:hypothetical protein